MAYFYEMPSKRKISGATIVVNGGSYGFGVGDADSQIVVTNSGDQLSIFPAGSSGDDSLYRVSVNHDALATRSSLADTIIATSDLARPPADQFSIEFRFAMREAATPIVRDVTKEIFGAEKLRFMTGSRPTVIMSTYRPHDANNVFDFRNVPGRVVNFRVFAAKYGSVERAFWLMLPEDQAIKSLMVVVSHGFGQNDAYYSKLGYSDPLSRQLLEDVRNRFVSWRWGRQVAAAKQDMGLLMPVRARAQGGTELGPFIHSHGVGARFISSILAKADAMGALSSINVVTYSSGIYDANAFVQIGGHGLKFDKLVNQDPARGTPFPGGNRRQYLSGWTTGGPRPGFDYLPKSRWANDPLREDAERREGKGYLHNWALPEYTLALALQS